MKLSLFTLLFYSTLSLGALANAEDQTVLSVEKQVEGIHKQLCADDSLNHQITTEALAPCVDCTILAEDHPIHIQDLNAVVEKVTSDDRRKRSEELEISFYRLADEWEIFRDGNSTEGMSLNELENALKEHERMFEKQHRERKKLQSLLAPEVPQEIEMALKNELLSESVQKILISEWEALVKEQEPDSPTIQTQIQTYKKQIEEATEEAALDSKYAVKVKMHQEELQNLLEPFKEAQEKLIWIKSGKLKNFSKHALWSKVSSDLIALQKQTVSAKESLQTALKSIDYNSKLAQKIKIQIEIQKNVKYGPIHSPKSAIESHVLKEFRQRAADLNKNHTLNKGFKSCGMSDAEILAIRWYTSVSYLWLNQAIRSGGEESNKVQPFTLVLNSALKKLRKYEGEAKRGVHLPPEVLAQHTVGSVINYSAFTSTSLGSGFVSKHMFVIKSKTGRYVGSHSTHYDEHEILFKNDTKFKILNHEVVGDKTHIVMEEVVE